MSSEQVEADSTDDVAEHGADGVLIVAGLDVDFELARCRGVDFGLSLFGFDADHGIAGGAPVPCLRTLMSLDCPGAAWIRNQFRRRIVDALPDLTGVIHDHANSDHGPPVGHHRVDRRLKDAWM